jgi:diguanylate cyclase (GGDEF)-like protein
VADAEHPMLPTVTADEVARLLDFVNWKPRDDRNAARIRAVVEANLAAILDGFYGHLLRFPELSEHLARPGRLDALKRTQAEYLLSLGRGVSSLDYARSRLRIGLAHDRVKLPPRWYIGAYAKLSELIGEHVIASGIGDPAATQRCLFTLRKLVQIDTVLAVEAYHHAALQRQESLLADVYATSRRLEELVRTDALTGVLSRRTLVDTLAAECDRARRFRHPFSILFIDIDRFKAINDLYGHGVGDDVLALVARTLRESLRPADIVGRYGGEEFVIGLVECPAAGAHEIAERIRVRIESASRAEIAEGIVVTVSIGLAVAEPGQGLEALLDRADQAMYQAKTTGRNRVCSLEPAAAA